jgi:hypothetical protein
VRTYVDDLLVISASTFEDHVQKLDIVLKLLSEHGLSINAGKTAFCANEIEYIGYWITKSGIQPMQKKVAAIKTMVAPKTCK